MYAEKVFINLINSKLREFKTKNMQQEKEYTSLTYQFGNCSALRFQPFFVIRSKSE